MLKFSDIIQQSDAYNSGAERMIALCKHLFENSDAPAKLDWDVIRTLAEACNPSIPLSTETAKKLVKRMLPFSEKQLAWEEVEAITECLVGFFDANYSRFCVGIRSWVEQYVVSLGGKKVIILTKRAKCLTHTQASLT